MTYVFALWVQNLDKGTKVSMMREVLADTEYGAYKAIIHDFYNYYKEDGDELCKVEIIEIH